MMMKRRKNTKRNRVEMEERSRRGAKILAGIDHIDYKDHELLKKFMTEQGKIIPARLTGASAKQQRSLKRAIRRARVMGLVR